MTIKSFVDGVATSSDIEDQMEPALSYQYMFERKTSPWEMSQWDQDELQQFNVQPVHIDRIYYIEHLDDGVFGASFLMLARQAYKDKSVFVEMSANCDYTGFDCMGEGEIFVTYSANIFFNVLIRPAYNREAVLRGLQDDGYYIDEMVAYPNPVERLLVHNPPMLKLLCHQSVASNHHTLAHYSSHLPKILADSVTEFIKINETKEAYDACI